LAIYKGGTANLGLTSGSGRVDAFALLFVSLLSAFAPLFSDRVWQQAQVLLIGAMLAPGKRTVTSCLRITGRSQERRFVNYHRVLSRACWSGQRNLPRSGTQFALAFCQGQRFALDQFDVLNANTVGRTYLGPPVSDLSGSQSTV